MHEAREQYLNQHSRAEEYLAQLVGRIMPQPAGSPAELSLSERFGRMALEMSFTPAVQHALNPDLPAEASPMGAGCSCPWGCGFRSSPGSMSSHSAVCPLLNAPF